MACQYTRRRLRRRDFSVRVWWGVGVFESIVDGAVFVASSGDEEEAASAILFVLLFLVVFVVVVATVVSTGYFLRTRF